MGGVENTADRGLTQERLEAGEAEEQSGSEEGEEENGQELQPDLGRPLVEARAAVDGPAVSKWAQ